MVKVEMTESEWDAVLAMVYTFRKSPAALRIHNVIEDQVK
jgi:hypothetical protein